MNSLKISPGLPCEIVDRLDVPSHLKGRCYYDNEMSRLAREIIEEDLPSLRESLQGACSIASEIVTFSTQMNKTLSTISEKVEVQL